MTRSKKLKSSQIKEFLSEALTKGAEVVLSFTRQGKWRILSTKIHHFDEESLSLEAISDIEGVDAYQPVGICVHIEHFKYLFESTVSAIENRCIEVDFPEKAEQMQRRAYDRQSVPANLKVKSLFWHRGYLDDSDKKPTEQYWQGRLINLSAGGAQIAVDMDQKEHFCSGQLLGIQFTPMSYQKPLLLESHVRYFVDQAQENQFLVGIEFLGLEASNEGHEVLERLVEVIDEYEKMNKENAANNLSD